MKAPSTSPARPFNKSKLQITAIKKPLWLWCHIQGGPDVVKANGT